MKYDVKHNCGHTQEHQLFGPNRQREYAKARMRERPCNACLRRIDQERAMEHADKTDLPDLSGTPKQIAWALVLRHETLAVIKRVIVTGDRTLDTPLPVSSRLAITDGETYTAQRMVEQAIDHESARWWIDHVQDVQRIDKRRFDDPFPPTADEFVRDFFDLLLGGRETREEMIKSGDRRKMLRALG